MRGGCNKRSRQALEVDEVNKAGHLKELCDEPSPESRLENVVMGQIAPAAHGHHGCGHGTQQRWHVCSGGPALPAHECKSRLSAWLDCYSFVHHV